MIDVVRLQDDSSKLREQVAFFVRRTGRTDYTDTLTAVFIANFCETLSDYAEGLFPGRWCQSAVLADERLGQAFCMVGEVEGVTALDAEEVVIDATLVAIVAAHDLHAGIGTAHAQ